MLCLDSNIIIASMRGHRPELSERLVRAFGQYKTIAVPVIVVMELRYGVARARNPIRARATLDNFLAAPFQILPFTEDDAERTGIIRADLARRGLTIGPFDVLIAAQALERDLTLVTNNTREFSRVPRLKIEDWL